MDDTGHVQRLTPAGTSDLAFRWGDTGTAFPFTRGDADAGLIAFTKAVTEGILRGEVAKMSETERAVADMITADYAKTRADVPTDPEPVEDTPLSYVITKSDDDARYTLGPLYAPDRADAHDEWTDADTLQKAVWGYVRASADTGRRLNLQHDTSGEATGGEWVEVMAWPYEHTIKVFNAKSGEEVSLQMPAGTVYMGVIWDEDVWPAVKSGKLVNGYSLGGRAVRVEDGDGTADGTALPDMGYKLAAAANTVTPATAEATAEAAAAAKAKVIWDPDNGMLTSAWDLVRKLEQALNPNHTCYCEYDCYCTLTWWVSDAAKGKALVFGPGDDYTAWVVPYTVSGDDVTVAAASEWVKTEQAWVAVARSRVRDRVAKAAAAGDSD